MTMEHTFCESWNQFVELKTTFTIMSTSEQQNGETETQAEEVVEQPGAPSLFLQKILGKRVLVRLNSGVDYTGILSCLDGYMNIAMEETIEVVNGQEKGSYGDAFIRGNNGGETYCNADE